MKKENYVSDLKNGNLTNTYVVELENLLRKHMALEDIPDNLIKISYLTENLSRLDCILQREIKAGKALLLDFRETQKI